MPMMSWGKFEINHMKTVKSHLTLTAICCEGTQQSNSASIIMRKNANLKYLSQVSTPVAGDNTSTTKHKNERATGKTKHHHTKAE